MGSLGFTVTPLEKPFKGSTIDFGAEISGIDVENLTGKQPTTPEHRAQHHETLC